MAAGNKRSRPANIGGTELLNALKQETLALQRLHTVLRRAMTDLQAEEQIIKQLIRRHKRHIGLPDDIPAPPSPTPPSGPAPPGSALPSTQQQQARQFPSVRAPLPRHRNRNRVPDDVDLDLDLTLTDDEDAGEGHETGGEGAGGLTEEEMEWDEAEEEGRQGGQRPLLLPGPSGVGWRHEQGAEGSLMSEEDDYDG